MSKHNPVCMDPANYSSNADRRRSRTAAPKSYKWELLTVLWMAFFLNQGDRQIYNAVLPLIKVDLHMSDVALGMVATGFTLLYAFLVPFAGILGDIVRKKWLLGASLLTFSLGTVCTGFSGGFLSILLFRSVATGMGEALYFPAASALIGQYHKQTRAQAMALHQSSLYIGIVVSSWLAGLIGQMYGWRISFYLFGGFGILVAAWVMARFRNEYEDAAQDSEIVSRDAEKQDAGRHVRESLRYVLRTPMFYALSIGYGGIVYVGVGYMTWMPTFLYEKFGLSLAQAGLSSMLYHYLFAFVGAITGGRFADRLAVKRPTVRMEIKCAGLLLGAPFIWLMAKSSSLALVYVALAGFGFFRGLYDSNLYAALFDFVPSRYRSSAAGLMLCFGCTVGSSAPVLLGYMKQSVGLTTGLASLSFVFALSAAALFVALKLCFARDYRPSEG